MAEQSSTLDHIVEAYQGSAAWISGLAALVFEVAERVLIVGAAKYAAAAVPSDSDSKIILTNVAAVLQLILSLWLVSKMMAKSSKDYKVLANAIMFQNKWARIAHRLAAFAFIVTFTWWLNSTMNGLVRQAVDALASPAGH